MGFGRVCWLVLLATTCTPREPRPSGPLVLSVRVDVRNPHAVRGEVHFVNSGTTRLELAGDVMQALTSVEVERHGGWEKVDPRRLDLPECARDCKVRYVLDLDRAERDHEGIVAVGADTFVAPTPYWLLRPAPMPVGAFDIRLDGVDEPTEGPFQPTGFATGLRRGSQPGRFTLPTDDFTEGSYAAFGRLRHRMVEASGGHIEVVVVGEEKLALSDDEVVRWVQDDAACVAQLYEHFPVARASVFIVPVGSFDGVGFGRVLSLGGASIIVFTGARLQARETHDDWVLVHEMVHLGFPTMYNVRWLTEGLATYYEPVLRTRAGWHSREWLWSDFLHAMPRGVPADGSELALDKRDTIDDVYWGGALFMLEADVGIRRATGQAKSLDDVLHAVLRKGGDATVIWSMAELVQTAREVTGTNVLGELVERMAVRGERLDLPKLFGELGVREASAPGTVSLDDRTPLGAVRKRIEGG